MHHLKKILLLILIVVFFAYLGNLVGLIISYWFVDDIMKIGFNVWEYSLHILMNPDLYYPFNISSTIGIYRLIGIIVGAIVGSFIYSKLIGKKK